MLHFAMRHHPVELQIQAGGMLPQALPSVNRVDRVIIHIVRFRRERELEAEMWEITCVEA
jgi:hypothetical protein